MKPDKDEKAARLVLSLICFTAYIAFFVAATASAFNTNTYNFILS